ncbi:molybdate transport system substrate-binding protein [Desulfomicrobium apsheronum]|uniref:Molybdate transport system substrate-binding protein n=1 Tax=Desulfomicrobium apsheronum TaxID=52560 RepID=A0A1I3S7M0_9BACT|nr:molybdate ABC transporter substrate-binding protein [Desulfomicrobium apsheronum]SFJ53557.1 molybdate transport system substrate-binding protein [Desulfomicrobium apsheronum]
MKKTLFTLLLVFLALPALAGNTLLIASGAGYKTVVEALSEAYAKQSDATVERIYGNMGQIIGQAQTSGKVDMLIGEEGFLRSSALLLAESAPLGTGRLVMAWPSGKEEPADLKSAAVTRIAVPDPKRAIYGKAAREYLENSGQADALKDKLVVVGTVPQVFTYLTTNEVDAGFINLTQAVAVKDKIGGFREMDQSLYDPIAISCIRLETSPSPEAARNFAKFLKTGTARSIIAAHGL